MAVSSLYPPSSAESNATVSSLQSAMARMAPYTYQQARSYYYGLPSRPTFVASTHNEVWALPTGLEAYAPTKMLRAVGEHKIVDLWEAGLADQVIACLAAMKVDWTSLDVVRIGIVGESSAPIILWIGVVPESLSGENGRTVAFNARKHLYDSGIEDIEVEIRESRVFKSVGPKLLTPAFSSNPLATVADPLTVTLGLPICVDQSRYADAQYRPLPTLEQEIAPSLQHVSSSLSVKYLLSNAMAYLQLSLLPEMTDTTLPLYARPRRLSWTLPATSEWSNG